ncbi:MAG: helix-turn-helix transcriptional regulator [Deltaproteobacteria bacterium]|jgi:DNA-binding XRE family transcriptional regulator|uniref:helix-turn-helix transcriptional regulator n=1 Tax=Desulfobacula sp. TaxID=2593537 RepID=UPI001DC6BCE5|nr:helix-turn-helix transcriptional regulator [Desulfobacteraceae bacterium]MBT4639470.1 helix-turn-helix transcriptional regulator [Deltaproteobacteria bacterium]MBT6751690.1 helix-turn-helix transcriptional regulator [Desulfobacula sp.]MBT6499298.1 helix-turn-helix transcriptional regulator [Deltaproteobacteria bacterium]MBT7715930.1 helix-turn-helix transcriptional regulator [Deltaproteobacteria bacterium]
MLAVVKKPRTKTPIFEVRGEIPDNVLAFLRKEFTVEIDDDEGSVDLMETDWYKETKAMMTPGKYIRIYRENHGYSQAKLGGMLGGLTRQNVSGMENGHRGISKEMAKKLAKIFQVPVSDFI